MFTKCAGSGRARKSCRTAGISHRSLSVLVTPNKTALLFAALWLGALGLSMVVGDAKELMRWYAVTLILASIGVVASRAISQPKTLLSCYAVVMLAPIWFFYLEGVFSGGDAWLLPANQVIKALSYCAFFLMMFNIFYRFTPPTKVTQFHEKRFMRRIKPALLPAVGITISLLTIAAIVIRYNFDFDRIIDVYAAGRLSGEGIIKRGGLGGVEVFLQPLEFMCTAVPTIAALSWVQFPHEKKAGLGARWTLLLFALLFIFLTFLTGTRSALAPFIAGPALVWLVFGRREVGKVPHIVITILLFIGLLGIWEFQKRKRTNLLEGVDSVGDLVAQTSFDISETHRDNNLYIATLYVMHMPSRFPFEGFHELYVYLVNPIPRVLWPGKPKSAHMEMTEKFSKGRTTQRAPGPVRLGPLDIGTFSLSLTVVGEGYRMFSYLGIAAYALIFGFLASNWDYIGQRRFLQTKLYFILNCAWLFAMLWGFRSGFALITGLYPVAAAYLLCVVAGLSGRPIPSISTNRARGRGLPCSSLPPVDARMQRSAHTRC